MACAPRPGPATLAVGDGAGRAVPRIDFAGLYGAGETERDAPRRAVVRTGAGAGPRPKSVEGVGNERPDGLVTGNGRPIGWSCGRGEPFGKGMPLGIVIWMGGTGGILRKCIAASLPPTEMATATSAPRMDVFRIGFAPEAPSAETPKEV